jgi:hypothetical protein
MGFFNSRENKVDLLLSVYILLIPLVNAFAPSRWTPLPLIFLLSLFLIRIFTLKVYFLNQKEDLFLFIFTFLSLITTIFSIDYFNNKTINHILALLTVIIIYYLFTKSILIKVGNFERLFKYCSISVFYVSLFIILEFISVNMFKFKIDEYIYRPIVKEYYSTMFGGIYYRPRGFAEESGLMAVFYEVFLPISVIYIRNKSLLFKLVYFSISLFSYLLLSSAVSILIAFIVILIWFLLDFAKEHYRLISIRGVLFIFFLLLFILFFKDIIKLYFEETVILKLSSFFSFQGYEPSSIDRLEKYKQFLNLFFNYPLGIGWGIAASCAGNYKGIDIPVGFISFYVEIISASGILGFFFFLCFIFVKIYKVLMVWSFNGKIYFISLLWALGHYIFISNYWLPWLWFLIGLIDIFHLHYKKQLNQRVLR